MRCFYGTGSYHRAAGHRPVSAHRLRLCGRQNRCAEAGGQTDPLEPPALSGRSGDDRPLLYDGVQRGDPAQPAGGLRDEHPRHPDRHGDHAAADGPPEGSPYADLSVCLRLFQRSLYGFPADLRPLWVGSTPVPMSRCSTFCSGPWGMAW